MPTKTETCERFKLDNGWSACHRCGNAWHPSIQGPDWWPLSCPARKLAPELQRDGVETQAN